VRIANSAAKTIRQTKLVSNTQNRRVKGNLFVHRHRLNGMARIVQAHECLLLTQVMREYMEYFDQIDHGNRQMRTPGLGLPHQALNHIGSRRVAK
jgi:hypothetical protein